MDDHRQTTAQALGPCYELRFESLHQPGRAIAVPCDAAGNVEISGLTERLRTAYFGARARMGRDLSYPQLRRVH